MLRRHTNVRTYHTYYLGMRRAASHPGPSARPIACLPLHRAKVDLRPGVAVQATVTAIHPHQLDVSLGGKLAGRVKISEVQ